MSIKQKLIMILLCAGLLPTITVGVVAYIIIGDQLRTTASNQLASIDIKQQEAINNILQNEQEQNVQLTNAYSFQLALTGYAAAKHGDNADLTSINSIIQQQQLADPTDIESISVAKSNGSVFASTVNGSVGQQLPSQVFAQINQGNDNAITIVKDPSDGFDKLHITTAITINNQEAGILDVTWSLENIIANLQDYTGLGQTGETVIAMQNSNGDAVALFPLRFDTGSALKTNLNSLQLFQHDNSAGTYSNVKDYRGHDVTVSARPVGFSDWVIATKIDNQEIVAPIMQLKNSLMIITIASSLIIIVIAWYLAQFFTRPILHIARVARLIGQGDLNARTPIRQNDEVGALGQSINAMGQNLRALVTRIETQRNQLQIILNSTVESIVALDKNGVIIIVNQATAELTELPEASLVNRRFTDIFQWSKDGKIFNIDYSQPGTHTYADLEYTTAAKNPKFAKVMVSQVSGVYEQSEAHTIITIHDETRNRELEAMKVDFVSMAAHELRTPLAAVRGYLELIKYKEGKHMTNESVSYLEHAHKSTAELGGLINNLLDVTRIERGTLALHMEPLDLAASAHQAVQDAHFNARDKHIELTYIGQQHGCMVMGDDIAIREIINNLISNAIKYTPEAGKIAVTLALKDGMYALSVQDTGYGIPQAALAHLFTKFYRVHGGLDSGSTGTGLGLYISKSIAERHHGSINVASQEGVGSTFTFTIPVLSNTPIVTTQQPTSPDLNMRSHRGWITKNIAR